MEQAQALAVVRSLANGVDPETGEVFPPESAYQLTTGTSVATAHISGIVALLLERNPKLTPDDIRKILTASAKRLGPNNEFGAGLVDPAKALRLAEPKSADLTTGTPARAVR